MNDGMNTPGPGIDDYETPTWLFKALDAEFGFTFDGAASDTNALLGEYATAERPSLDWSDDRVYCNPPYSDIDKFISLALASDGFSVLLLPVRSDTRWFQRLVESPRVTLRFFRKRIRFCLGGKEQDSPRFGSVIAIVRPR